MAVDRSKIVEENFLRYLAGRPAFRGVRPGPDDPVAPGRSLRIYELLELFESQVISRHLDFEARALKRRDLGYYTIGSAGHEGNAVLGRLVRSGDPSFLHYRSGALMVERARQVPGSTPLFDILLGMVAAKDDPASGGRHKVFGSRRLWVPPQTSTIASHLPKAVGCAFALDRAHQKGIPMEVPRDAIVLCTFGDASVNHSTAQGAFNTASWTAFQNLPLPILFVCEDNHIGISVRTPRNWIKSRCSGMPHIPYFHADGLDLLDSFETVREAVDYVRSRRRPALVHMEVVRLLGHAGSDVETEYLLRREIEANESNDPLLRSASLVLECGAATAQEIEQLYSSIRDRVSAAAAEASRRRKLASASEVMAPLAPYTPGAVAAEARRPAAPDRRLRLFGGAENLPERSSRPRHLAVQLNRALLDALAAYPELMIFGEDVGRKGGVYHVTSDLTRKASVARVFNTLLDETTILGIAIGAAHLGLLPVPEIQYLAYYHNAEDQLRSEACSLQFFSNGQFSNPMVLRIASFGYQRGFGGHFHNDSSIAALRDLPGVVIAAPARPEDAVGMLRTCLALAKVDGRVVVFLEPIALYMAKDLYEPGDGLWQSLYPPPGEAVDPGLARVHRAGGADLTIVSYANGLYYSLRAAERLEREHGIGARVVDLRWIAPLDEECITHEIRATGRGLIVDEGRRTGGISEGILTMLVERAGSGMPKLLRVAAEDTYIPLGPAANTVLPTEESILQAALRLVSGDVP